MPPKNVLIALAALAVVAGLGVFFALRGEEVDPRDVIRARLEAAAKAAEAKDTSGVMEVVSESYPDRADVKRVVFAQLRGDGWKRARLVDIQVELAPTKKRAKTEFKAVLARGDSKDGTWKDLAPSDATVYRFEADLELESDGEWRITNAVWERGRFW